MDNQNINIKNNSDPNSLFTTEPISTQPKSINHPHTINNIQSNTTLNQDIKTGKVLLVDDEEIVHLTLKRLLKSEGYIVESAYGAKEALEKIKDGYDLLISDVRMPDMDGIELVREIRKREIPVEIITLTGFASLESATHALKYGVRDYLMKPIKDIPEFKDKVKKSVEISQLTRKNKELYKAIMSGDPNISKICGNGALLPALTEENKTILQQLLQVIHDAIVVLNKEGRITYTNVQFANMVGISYEEIFGNHISQYIKEEEQKDINKILEKLTSGEVSAKIESHIKSKIGNPLSVIISFTPLYQSQEYHGTALVITDNTEIKKVREKVDMLATLVENSQSDMMFVIKPDGQIIECNTLAKQFFGYEQNEILSLTLKDLFKATEDESWYKISESIKQKSWWKGELVAICKDKTKEYILESTVSSSGKYDNSRSEMICFMRDVTARKKAEEALIQKSEELARSNKDLEQFATVASHDLQEPLRMVSSYTQLLAKRYKGKLDQDAEDFINYAVDGASRMQKLINDLLDYSRVSSRGKTPELVDTDLLLKQALDNLRFLISETSAQITHGLLPKVMADGAQLTQVFQNLINNAIKFRGDRIPEISISAVEKENEWIFSVKDNGIGIEKEFFDRIFVIFQRLHTRKYYEGNGIGLAICKKIVERHKGRIWVDSEAGKGTEFHFTIPIKIDEEKFNSVIAQ